MSENLILKGLFVDPQNLHGNCAGLPFPFPLWFLGLTLSKRCNYHCRYCAQDGGKRAARELDQKTLCDLIHQAKDLGAKSVVLAGAGEPLLDPAFPAVIERAAALGLTTVLYSNGSRITRDLARFLYAHDVSVCLKLDTLDEISFNWLTDTNNAFQRTMRGLENLLAVGYGEQETVVGGYRLVRLAINAVVTRSNLSDLPNLAVYCAKQGIKLFLDNLSLAGRAVLHWKELITTPEEYVKLCEEINSRLGYAAVGHSLDRADACILWKYGIVIYLDGEARICYDDPPVPRIGSIYEHSLAKLVHTKQTLHPPKQSFGDCPLKCLLRERLWKKEGSKLSPSEAIAYFGSLAHI
ncbi:MAG: radical SAM protein [Anaerolineales bacterium]